MLRAPRQRRSFQMRNVPRANEASASHFKPSFLSHLILEASQRNKLGRTNFLGPLAAGKGIPAVRVKPTSCNHEPRIVRPYRRPSHPTLARARTRAPLTHACSP